MKDQTQSATPQLGEEPGLEVFMPNTSEGFTARAGKVLTDSSGPVDPDVVEGVLKTVHDPEIPVNIFDLGLIYSVD